MRKKGENHPTPSTPTPLRTSLPCVLARRIVKLWRQGQELHCAVTGFWGVLWVLIGLEWGGESKSALRVRPTLGGQCAGGVG